MMSKCIRYWYVKVSLIFVPALSKYLSNRDAVTMSLYLLKSDIVSGTIISSIPSCCSATSWYVFSCSLKRGGNCRWSPTNTIFLPRSIGINNSGGVALLTSSIITTSKSSKPFSVRVRAFSVQETPTTLQPLMKSFR